MRMANGQRVEYADDARVKILAIRHEPTATSLP